MGKAPAFQFYPNDWMRDLEEHPLEIEGAWIRLCCKLWWSETRGKLTKTINQWVKILRETEENTNRILNYIDRERLGDIFRDCNGDVTVVSRRMVKDEKERELTRLRVQRHREKRVCNDSVTPMKHYSSSSSSSSKELDTKVSMCPQSKIVDLWHEILPELPRVKDWGPERQDNLRVRWREKPERQDMEWWRRFFLYIRTCPFLMGEVEPRPGHKHFFASLPWILKKANFLKIIEGEYDRRV